MELKLNDKVFDMLSFESLADYRSFIRCEIERIKSIPSSNEDAIKSFFVSLLAEKLDETWFHKRQIVQEKEEIDETLFQEFKELKRQIAEEKEEIERHHAQEIQNPELYLRELRSGRKIRTIRY